MKTDADKHRELDPPADKAPRLVWLRTVLKSSPSRKLLHQTESKEQSSPSINASSASKTQDYFITSSEKLNRWCCYELKVVKHYYYY